MINFFTLFHLTYGQWEKGQWTGPVHSHKLDSGKSTIIAKTLMKLKAFGWNYEKLETLLMIFPLRLYIKLSWHLNLYSLHYATNGQRPSSYLKVKFLMLAISQQHVSHSKKTFYLIYFIYLFIFVLQLSTFELRYVSLRHNECSKFDLRVIFLDISLIYSIAPTPYPLQLRCIN